MANATTQLVATLSQSLRRNASVLASTVPRARRGEVRAIHRLRVATRRLRETLPASVKVTRLNGADGNRLIRDLRRVTKGLGPVRELDVARGVLEDLAAREGWPSAVVSRVDGYCERLRERAFKDAAEALDALDARATRRQLDDLAADAAGAAKAGASMVMASLAARVREAGHTLVRQIDAAGTLYAPPALHQIRIAAKKLRYVLELSGQSVPGSVRRLKRLQAALGRLHDAQVLQHRIQELAATSKNRSLVGTLTAMDHAIEAACRAWHAKVLKTLPGIAELAKAIVKEVPATIRPRQFVRPVRMGADEIARRRKRIA